MPRPAHPIAPDSIFAMHGQRLIHEKLQVLRLLRGLDRAGIHPAKVTSLQTPLVRLAEVDQMLTAIIEGFERFGCTSMTEKEKRSTDQTQGLFAIAEEARSDVREALPPSEERYLQKALGEVTASEPEIWMQVDEFRGRTKAAGSRGAGATTASGRRRVIFLAS